MYPKGYRGFESLSLRHSCFICRSQLRHSCRPRKRTLYFRFATRHCRRAFSCRAANAASASVAAQGSLAPQELRKKLLTFDCTGNMLYAFPSTNLRAVKDTAGPVTDLGSSQAEIASSDCAAVEAGRLLLDCLKEPLAEELRRVGRPEIAALASAR